MSFVFGEQRIGGVAVFGLMASEFATGLAGVLDIRDAGADAVEILGTVEVLKIFGALAVYDVGADVPKFIGSIKPMRAAQTFTLRDSADRKFVLKPAASVFGRGRNGR